MFRGICGGVLMQEKQKGIFHVAKITFLANILIACLKLGFAIKDGSLALQADAISSFADGLLALVVMVGIYLSQKPQDRKHPFGYGRYEYLTDAIVSFLVLFAGVELLLSSLKGLHQVKPLVYDTYATGILVLSFLLRLYLGTHEKKASEQYRSRSLKAASIESYLGAFMDLLVITDALLVKEFRINIDAYLSLVISLFILRAGYHLIRQTVADLLGQRVDSTIIHQVKEVMMKEEGVLGVYDMSLHSYGLETFVGSCHIEVDSHMTMLELDRLERRLVQQVYQETEVLLLGISIYCKDSEVPSHIALQKQIEDTVLQEEDVLQVHGFYVDDETHTIFFDVVKRFEGRSCKQLHDALLKRLEKLNQPYQYHVVVDMDVDIS